MERRVQPKGAIQPDDERAHGVPVRADVGQGAVKQQPVAADPDDRLFDKIGGHVFLL